MREERVTIEDGGRAIVGNVEHRGAMKKSNVNLMDRGGSVCLNGYQAFLKWISALVMPLPVLAAAC